MTLTKNWLIRTKNLQILGPVSKEKIKELLDNNSLFPMDEICSGNGFWFFIKEKELLDMYIYNDQVQGYNPISEAISVYDEEDENLINQDEHLPSTQDLEYPELGPKNTHGEINVTEKKNSNNH